MERLNLRKLLLEENRLYNLMSAGCGEIEAYRLVLDPLYFEREYLQNPKIKNEMETKNKNEKTYWVIGCRKLYEKDLTYLANGGGETKSVNEAMIFEFNPSLPHADKCNLYSIKITEPIYKEGDILATNSGNVFIFDKYDNIEDSVYDKAFLWYHGGFGIDDTPTSFFNYISGFATESQKQRLFDALEKEGKRWNAGKKVVEDIIKPCSMSFAVKLNQESVDRLMGGIDKMREDIMDSKKKAEELFKKIQELANPKLSEMAKLKQTLEENYEIESADFTQNRSGYLDGTPAKLIVTYKPRRK
jgi:hypothetical protein